VRAHPRGGGNNDGWRPPSPPRVPFGAPPCPTRVPPFSPSHCGLSARRLPAGRPPGPPRFPQHPPSRGRGYRSCSPPRLPRPLPPGPPLSPPRRPPHFRGGTDDYRPPNPPRQPWGPPLARQRPTGARQGAAAGTGRGPCRGTPRALLPDRAAHGMSGAGAWAAMAPRLGRIWSSWPVG